MITARNTPRLLRALNYSAPPPESVVAESDLVVILAALLCALICLAGLIAVVRCAWLRQSSAGGELGGHSEEILHNNNNNRRGLKKKVVESLPKISYDGRDEYKGGGGALRVGEECGICLAEYGDGEEIRVLPPCSHSFHVRCIDTWLASHSSCPSCRRQILLLRLPACQKCGHSPAATANISGCVEARRDHAYPPAFLP
ncbi:probable E3 ubiquitin-protein ligase ATL44 [Malania oleifera]|uniref:probable E3 ubiquitin-protein ligase ATL44 n=1 Tax=Malania oleifera TaxID=397392 RepID=UPI0025AE1F0D|nr:probable E3 ubiquitin-protein ligase ATL44 [Malania oleifera]